MTEFVLASASPARKALLAQIDIQVDRVIPAAIEEISFPRERPGAFAQRMANEKAQKILQTHQASGRIILAADTVVAMGRRILPKVADEETARHCLARLSGRKHDVYGGIALIDSTGKMHQRKVKSTVTFNRLTPNEIAIYLASEQWRGKAGGYAIQGLAAAYMRQISGSYSNIVGLSLFDVQQLLKGIGYR